MCAVGFCECFGCVWKKKNYHHLRLYLEKTADNADARVASPSVLLTARARSRLTLAQRVAVLPSAKPAVAAALALLFDFENNFGSSKAAATSDGAKRLSVEQVLRGAEGDSKVEQAFGLRVRRTGDAGLSVAKTATDESDKLESGAHTCSGCATSCAGVKRLHQRYLRFSSCIQSFSKPEIYYILDFT